VPPLVVVVGSINQDTTFVAERWPGPGETLAASDVFIGSGGKGANQAVAAAATGVRTVLIAAVGADAAGREQVAALQRGGVDTSAIVTVAAPTGMAAIMVTPEGENSILLAPGANALLTVEHVLATRPHRPDVIVAQTEVPPATVGAAAALATELGCRFVLNPAPVVTLAAATLALADPLVVNVHEAADLLARAGVDVPDQPHERAAAVFAHARPRSLVVTLGGDGAVLIDGNGTELVAAPTVTVVDTTGAGDSMIGTLAARLALGDSLADALHEGVEVASRSVAHRGTRTS
jgi:ribokinase